jgi:hypothetical protein
MKRLFLTGLALLIAATQLSAQQTRKINLVKAGKDGLLETYLPNQVTPVEMKDKQAIAVKGIVWLKDISFKDGQIDVDLRGKNVLQQSFLGIAFHGKDTGRYEVVYFRPFNFGSVDTLRRKHAVQYMSMPDHPWYQLRKDQPLAYESAVQPVPGPEEWFHATIVIRDGWVMVYVNHAQAPSLKIKELGNYRNGKIGLWTDGLPGEFANLALE